MSFKGSTAVVTGGSSGIGLAIAKAFLGEGAYVLIADLAEPPASELVDIGAGFGFCHHDISSEDSWQGLFARLASDGRKFDILVNCAGIMKVADVGATDSALFDRTMAINAGGTFLGCKYAIRALLANEQVGAIVNVASTAAIKPAAWVAAYAASKAAVVSVTRSVALQCAQSGYPIRCNAVLPGVVLTPMVQGMVDAAPDPAAALAGLEAQHPIGRLVCAEEIAAAVLFLASARSSGITGASLVVDGGMTAG